MTTTYYVNAQFLKRGVNQG